MAADGKLDGREPIGPDEIIFRRVLESQYKPVKNYLSPKGFQPRQKKDETGISVCRADYLDEPKPQSVAALGLEGNNYFVVELSAKSLADAGMQVHPEPIEGCIGHAVIPALKAEATISNTTLVLMDTASKLAIRIHGPFPGRAPKAHSS